MDTRRVSHSKWPFSRQRKDMSKCGRNLDALRISHSSSLVSQHG